ncbi:VCBS repeat-containing protein [Streptomyces sp. NPDC005500]|uniref:FG-GAP repeat domain-containing protein n=1 Tax=Streptomyces sp. NPDC005500 TaxID=3155007 RepID=UPI0033B07FC1
MHSTNVPAPASAVAQLSDFNGDGFPDLAVASYDGTKVHVYNGEHSGLNLKASALFTPRSPGMPRGISAAEGFDDLVSGDLDQDGYADLVLHAIGEEIPDELNTVVLWGAPDGLTRGASYLQHLPALSAKQRRMTADPDTSVDPDTDVNHTMRLQVGDFDDDRDVDLMRFADDSGPSELFHGPFNRKGSARYVTPTRAFGVAEGDSLAALSLVGSPGSDPELGVVTNEEQGSHGRQLTSWYPFSRESRSGRQKLPPATAAGSGDIDCDGRADLVLSEAMRYEGSESSVPGGQVSVVYGSPDGYGKGRTTLHVTRDSPGVPAASQPDSLIGHAQALGDVNGDGCADVTVSAGVDRLLLFKGSRNGLRTEDAQVVTVQQLDLPPTYDHAPNGFGGLGLMDLNSDKYADLVAGPLRDAKGHGVPVVLHGSRDGFDAAAPLLITEPSSSGAASS